MIYDCFIFNNELDLLDLRLHELDSVVDKFVLVESTSTFSGKRKPLYYQQNQSRFAKFKNKIIHVVVRDMDQATPAQSLSYFQPKDFQLENLGAWSREIHQRNAIKRGLRDCNLNDIILISDVDEIPRATIVSKLKALKIVQAFEQKLYLYYYNCRAKDPWYGTRAIKYSKNIIPESVRVDSSFKKISNGGWHFSYIGGVDKIKQKLSSYSHQENNIEKFRNSEKILYNIQNGLDLFGRPYRNEFCLIDSTYPSYFRRNISKFASNIFESRSYDNNTKWLREEIVRAREELYWKSFETNELKRKLSEIKHMYRLAILCGPLSWVIIRVHKFIKKYYRDISKNYIRKETL